MLSIGDFARFGEVSVRMLRHYDRIGLLTPARVDEWSGYRSYRAEQFARLNRIVALKELGFTLEQVRQILDGDLGAQELRGMLVLRRAQIATEQARAQVRLADVESRLRLIEKENHMSDTDYVLKPLPSRTVLGRHATAATQPEIAGVVGPIFGEVAGAIAAAGGRPETGVGVYDMTEDGMNIFVGYDYAGSATGSLESVTLPEVDEAVCAVHLGEMATIGESWQQLSRWIDANGWTTAGSCREIYLRADPSIDQREWVTELQQPVTRA